MMLKTRKGGITIFETPEQAMAREKIEKKFEEMLIWGRTAPEKKKRIRRKMNKHENSSRV